MAQGSIHKRQLDGGRVRWDVIVDLGDDPLTGKRRQRKRTFATKRAAETGLNAWLFEIEHGTAIPASKMTVGEYLTYWLTTSAKHRVRPSTYESYERLVRCYIIPALGAISLQKLTPAQVQAFYSAQLTSTRGRSGQGLSPRTVRYFHALLHRALKEALALGMVARNVTEAVAPPKATRPPIKSWDVDDAQRFLETAGDDGYSPIWLLALHTGMRQGELLGLRWRDIDLAGKRLHVQQTVHTERDEAKGKDVLRFGGPKTASGRRTIALDAPTVAALREYRARQVERRLAAGTYWQDLDLVFCNEIGGIIDPTNLYHRFVALAARAGVPRLPFHGLRHTHATLLMKHGVHPKVASERLGHADISLTLSTYSHVLPQMQQDAADTFAAALTRASDGRS